MAAWGVGIYSNDVADDLRSFLGQYWREGFAGEELVQKILSISQRELEDPEDSEDFWLALADLLWKKGMLTEEVKQKALSVIRAGDPLHRWEEADLWRKRQKALQTLANRLEQEQPPEQRPKKVYVPYICDWSVGDVFAWKLESEEAIERHLDGRYVLLEMLRTHSPYGKSDQYPVVRLKLTEGDRIPGTKEEYEAIPFLTLGGYYYRKKNMQDGSITWVLDGFKYEMMIDMSSGRAMPKKCVLIGNFSPVQPLPEQYYVKSFLNVYGDGAYWKNLESKLLKYIRINEAHEAGWPESYIIDEEGKEHIIEYHH